MADQDTSTGQSPSQPGTIDLSELDEIQRYFPRFWGEAAHLFTETLYEDVDLDAKTIQLILMALLAAWRWPIGLRVHAEAALREGATPAQVRGAVLLSMAVAGTSAAASSMHVIEDVLEAHR